MAMHNDESIVNRIIDQKTRNQEFKEHPDAPGDINAMLFYVLVDLESVAEDEHAERVEVEVGGDAFGSEAPYLICMSSFKFKFQIPIPWMKFQHINFLLTPRLKDWSRLRP